MSFFIQSFAGRHSQHLSSQPQFLLTPRFQQQFSTLRNQPNHLITSHPGPSNRRPNQPARFRKPVCQTVPKRQYNVYVPSHSRLDDDSRSDIKPRYSYKLMIAMAIRESKEKRLTLSEIYSYIMRRFPYYAKNPKNWRNSIRHNLSLKDCFQKEPRVPSEGMYGSYWILSPNSEITFENDDFR